eukprot:3023228-Pyramimonas_sp.AAC.2
MSVDDWDPFGGMPESEFASALLEDESEEEEEEEPTISPAQAIKTQLMTVPRVDLAGITMEQFRNLFLLVRRPVVLVDSQSTCVPMHLTT